MGSGVGSRGSCGSASWSLGRSSVAAGLGAALLAAAALRAAFAAALPAGLESLLAEDLVPVLAGSFVGALLGAPRLRERRAQNTPPASAASAGTAIASNAPPDCLFDRCVAVEAGL